MKPAENPTRKPWILSSSCIGMTELRGAYQLINPQHMDRLFGNPQHAGRFIVYMVKNHVSTAPEQVAFDVLGTVHCCLREVMVAIGVAQTKRAWIYTPEHAYVIYIEEAKFLCMDFAHFAQGETPTVEIGGLVDPLHDLGELTSALEAAHKFMLEAAKVRAQVKDSDPSKCTFCSAVFGGEPPITCIRCRLAFYCNRTCQGKHVGLHQKVCREVKGIKPGDEVPMYARDENGDRTREVIGSARADFKPGVVVDEDQEPSVFQLDVTNRIDRKIE